jgi:M6 family metalloprotease-like protein
VNLCKNVLLSILLVLLTASLLYAGPAVDDFIDIAQPDGTSFKARKFGDEYQNWAETESGYTVVRNKKNKEWEYATRNPDGTLQPSGQKVVPHGKPPEKTPKHLKPPRKVDEEQNQSRWMRDSYLERAPAALSPSSDQGAGGLAYSAGDWTPTPVSGIRKLIVILVNFSDRSLVTSASDWSNSLFSTATDAKSVVNYYKDNSFNLLTVSPLSHSQPQSPAGVVTVSVPYVHPDNGTPESTWVAAAINAADPFVDFKALDSNGNGYIDRQEALVYLIPAGYEESGTAQVPSVWAHARWFSSGGFSAAGKLFPAYAMSGELNASGVQHPMGVIAHELGHEMCGLPDLYDTSSHNEGLGHFSLMAGGSWGKDVGESGGVTPTNLDAWSREYLGWTTPITPTTADSLRLDHPLSAPNAAYKLLFPSVSSTEYFLVENRQPVGWDRGLRGMSGFGWWDGGLLITHIDITAGSVGSNDINNYATNAGRQGVVPVPADDTLCDMLNGLGCRGNATTLFYFGNNSLWSPLTDPNSNYYDGSSTNVTLADISAPSSIMTASLSLSPVASDDVYEDNDSMYSAAEIRIPFWERDLKSNDDDWYKVWVQKGETITVEINFSNANGDLDLFLYDSDGNFLDGSFLTNDDEYVVLGPAGADGEYYIKVAGFSGSKNSYMMSVETYTTSLPDLRSKYQIGPASTVTEGDSSAFSAYIYNSGLSSAGGSHAKLYLSLDGTSSTSRDYYVGSVAVPPLPAMSGQWVNWIFPMPDLGSGSYMVWGKVIVDSLNEVSEGKEDSGPFVSRTGENFFATDDTKPDPFAFTARTGVALSAEVTSNTITVSGINAPAPITITGGSYSINGGAYTDAAGTVKSGDTVTVRLTSSAYYSTTTMALLTIGGVSAAFSVATPEDTTPNPFAFTAQTNVALNTVATSNSITVSGITAAVPISITGASYSINGGTFTAAAGTVINGKTVRVRLTSPATYSSTATATLTIGGVSGAFRVTTLSGPPVLDLSLAGTGGGSVSGDMSCVSGTNCTAKEFVPGTIVSLWATPDAKSTFGGWGGACSGTASNCSLIMDVAKSVTATFAAAPKVMVNSAGFPSFQRAYDDGSTRTGGVIKMLGGSLVGDIVAGRSITVTVAGGYNADYRASSTETVIHGNLMIRGGRLTVRNLVLGSPHIPGDLNNDGTVDLYDYNILYSNYGNTTCGNIADINGDCVVDGADYSILHSNYGKSN